MGSQKIVVQVDAEIKELIPGYLENRKNEIHVLESLCFKKDFEAISKIAHKLKGNAAGYGFTGLGELAIQLEKESKKSDAKATHDCIQSMRHYLNHVKIEYVEDAA